MKILSSRTPSPIKRRTPTKLTPFMKVTIRTRARTTTHFQSFNNPEQRENTPNMHQYDLSTWEKRLLKRKQIIRTDGYIANSVIRKRLNIPKKVLSIPKIPEKSTDNLFEALKALRVSSPATELYKVYRPKFIYKQEVKKEQVNEAEGEYQAPVDPPADPDDDSREPTPFFWTEAEDEEEEEEVKPRPERRSSSVMMPRRRSIVRVSSTMSNYSVRGCKTGRSTPSTPMLLKSKQYDFVRGELHSTTPDPMRRAKPEGLRTRERSSFNLTNIVVDEDSTKVRYKKAGKVMGLTDMSSIQKILQDDLFSDMRGSPSLDNILQRLLQRLDNHTSLLNSKMCNYARLLHRDIGIPHNYLDSITNRLILQMDHVPGADMKEIITALKEIGGGRQEVIAAILPKLLHAQVDVRRAAAEALADLTDGYSEEDMMNLIQSDVRTKSSRNRHEEIEALKALAKRLNVKLKPSRIIMQENPDIPCGFDQLFTPSFDDDSRASENELFDVQDDLSEFLGSVPETPVTIDNRSDNNSDVGLAWLDDTKPESFMWNRLNIAGMTNDSKHPGTFKRGQSFESNEGGDEVDSQEEINAVMKELNVMRLQDDNYETWERTRTREPTEASLFLLGSKNSKRRKKRSTLKQRNKLYRDETQMDSKRSSLVFPFRHPASPGSDSLNSMDSSRLTPFSRAHRKPCNSEDEDDALYSINREMYSDSDLQSPDEDEDREDGTKPIVKPWVEEMLIREGYKESDKDKQNVQENDEGHEDQRKTNDGEDTPLRGTETENDASEGTSLDALILEGKAILPNQGAVIRIPTDEGFPKTKEKVVVKKRVLTPVQSVSVSPDDVLTDISNKQQKKHKAITPPPDWRKFFDTPTAQERKRRALLKQKMESGRIKPTTGATIIHCIEDNVPVVPIEAGLRVLHTVRVSDKRTDLAFSDKHNIKPLPGKLAVNTESELMGNSNFGIIQMQWSTGVPAGYFARMRNDSSASYSEYLERSTTSLSDGCLPIIKRKDREPQIKTKNRSVDLKISSILPKNVKPKMDYKWEEPLPPPPGKESRLDIQAVRDSHQKYCEEYEENLKEKQMANVPRTAESEFKRVKPRLRKFKNVALPPLSLRNLLQVVDR